MYRETYVYMRTRETYSDVTRRGWRGGGGGGGALGEDETRKVVPTLGGEKKNSILFEDNGLWSVGIIAFW